MGSVYANGLEVSGKAQPNKSIAAMPSVCLSPPSPPAGPIPIPYPVTATASDTADGTGSVQIKGKEVGKKNGSVYSKCDGNQPATRSFGMDVASHTLEGKTKFAGYSFDVQFEKGGAERFTDLTTSNHSNTGTATTASAAGGSSGAGAGDCEALEAETARMRGITSSNQALAEDARAQKQAYTKEYRAAAEARIDQRLHGAHTASQSGGGPMQLHTSNGLNRATLRQRGVGVQSQQPVNGTGSNVCGGGEDYEDEAHKYHTEAQMLEGLDWNARAPVTFSTNWPAMTNGRLDPARANRPCEDCQRKMAEACECGLKIFICQGGKPVDYCASIGAGQ